MVFTRVSMCNIEQKAYCITLRKLSSSCDQAQACVRSGHKHGMTITTFDATDKFRASKEAAALGIPSVVAFDDVETKRFRPVRAAQLGCFVSHFRIWEKAAISNDGCYVFEHDALIIDRIPKFDVEGVVNLQDSVWRDPSWAFFSKVSNKLRDPEYREPDRFGLAFSEFICLPGTCAYWISPSAAAVLIRQARNFGPLPVDLFINKRLVPIMDLNPFPVVPDHKESTIAPNADWSEYEELR